MKNLIGPQNMKLKKGTLLFLLLTCLAYTTLAQTNYTLHGDHVTIDGNGKITACSYNFGANPKGTNLTIPQSVTKNSETIIIKVISSSVFKEKNLTSLRFEDKSEITTIGAYAFQKNKIQTITLPPTVTTIGEYAFYQNNDQNTGTITTITLPASLTTIKNGAFASVGSNKDANKNPITKTITVTLPASLKTIGNDAFHNTKIKTLNIPADSKLETIGNKAFRNNKIVTLTLPASLKTIGKEAFEDNPMTGKLNIPANSKLTTIGDGAFYGDDLNIKGTITLPPTLTTIGKNAFRGNHISEIKFNDDPIKSQIKNIGKDAFFENTGTFEEPTFGQIYLPFHAGGPDVTYLDSKGNTYNQTTDDGFGPSRTFFSSFDISITAVIPSAHILQAADLQVNTNGIIIGCNNCDDFTRITIPDRIGGITITGIGEEAFDGLNLLSVKFAADSKVTTIGNAAFQDNKIAILELPASLKTIGNAAFKGNDIVILLLPASLETIEESAFQNNKLTEVTFNVNPNKSQIRSIGKDAFTGNDRLTSIPLPQHAVGNKYKDIAGNEYSPGHLFTAYDKSLVTVIPPYRLTEDDVTVEDGIITECSCTFVSNHIIIPVQIGTELITGIGKEAFSGKNLVTVTFARVSNINSIGEKAFYNNDIITITLPPSLETIGKNAFADNTLLLSFELPLLTIEGYRTYWTNENLKEDLDPTIGQASFIESFKRFSVQQVTLTTTVEGQQGGTISRSVDPNSVDPDNEMKGLYDINEVVPLTAIPANQDWRFDRWVITGREDETQKDVEVTINANKTATAYFVQQFTLTTTVEGQQGGTITRSVVPNSVDPDNEMKGLYDIDKVVKLTAKPKVGWRFDKWRITGGEKEDGNPITEIVDDVDHVNVTIDVNKTVTVYFVELVTLTLTIKEPTGGTPNEVSELSAGENTIDKGKNFELKAVPAPAQKFVSWTINGLTIANKEYTLSATTTQTAISITVTFEYISEQVTLTQAIKGEGSIAPSVKPNSVDPDNKMKGLYNTNTKVTLTATPADGWRFDKWMITGGEDENGNPITVTVVDVDVTADVDKIATAYFVQQVTLTLATVEEGSITTSVKPNSVDPNNEMKSMYDIKTEVTLTATPADGWRFDKWRITGGEDENGNPITVTDNDVGVYVTVDADKTATAYFVKEEAITITGILTEVVSATPYPNPVTSQIALKAKDGDLIQLFSQKGEQQYSTQHTGNEIHTIDVTAIPVGVYLVRITDAEGNTTTKRIVKK